MFRSKPRLTGYILPVSLVALSMFPLNASAQRLTETAIHTPPTLSVSTDTPVVSSCQDAGASRVSLNAKANSSSGNPINYHWTTDAGRINGDGPTVNWDMSGLAPGVYRAFLEIDTGGSDGTCTAFSSTSVVVRPCPPPPCPSVEIVCPTGIGIDQPLTFSSRVTNAAPGIAPLYNWSVSAGTITQGQGTDTIIVDTKGLAGQTVRASLAMGGYTKDCPASCSIQIPLPIVKPRKFDEFPDIRRNDEKARLDNYAIEIQNDPTATAYVLIYPGRSGKAGEVQKHTARILDYLVNSRGIDSRRIITLVGPPKEELMIELWIAPQGVTPPRP